MAFYEQLKKNVGTFSTFFFFKSRVEQKSSGGIFSRPDRG